MRASPLLPGFEALWYRNHPLHWLLVPATGLYRLVARLRREAYRRGWLKTVEVAVPVVVVGNVSVGGTGKTPFVIWLAGQLKLRGRRVGIVTRGYRGKSTASLKLLLQYLRLIEM